MLQLIKGKKNYFLIGAILLQVSILAGEYLNSIYPLWTGKSIRLSIIPVDPRSLFQGHFVRLKYDIGDIKSDLLKEKTSLPGGTVVYVSLEEKNSVYQPTQVSIEKPDRGVFLKGRLTNSYHFQSSRKLKLKYGIEAYFLPEEKAKQMEKDFQKSRKNSNDTSPVIGIAEAKVASNGKAALVGVEVNH